jgi:hypothetical protein
MRAVVIAQSTRRKYPGPVPAWQLYRGSQQQLVQQGLSAVWERFGFRQGIDEVLLSPLHGPMVPDQLAAPYDYSWKSRPKAEVARHVQETRVIERLQDAVAGFDLVLVLLSATYLGPLRMPAWVPATAPQRWLYFASSEGLPFVPAAPNVRIVPAGTPEARAAGVMALDVKSWLFRRLCLQVAAEGEGALAEAWAKAQPVPGNP